MTVMPPRRELCRNFQRGSCQYGDRCKFLHTTPQQSKTNSFGSGVQQQSSNPFGFGVQQQASNPFGSGVQQQASNPFGFGVQNGSHTGGRNDIGSETNQFKPFKNKWIRDSSKNASDAVAARPSNSQPQAANHECHDPESCKRIMVEDFEHEMPQWKLTCYGHRRNGPCDIVGDISFEELRGIAYDDAKRGLSLHSIIDREKSLVNSKLVEFQNLVHKPYVVPSGATSSAQRTFAGTSSNAFNNNTTASHSVSSFSQLNASMNTRSPGTSNYAFGQVSPPQTTSQPFSRFQTSTMPLNSSGTFFNQVPHQAVESSFSFNSAPSNSVMNAYGNPFSTSSKSSQMANVVNSNMKSVSDESNIVSNSVGQSSISVHDNVLKVNIDVDLSIWNKTDWKWNVGEIPEDEPPRSCIY